MHRHADLRGAGWVSVQMKHSGGGDASSGVVAMTQRTRPRVRLAQQLRFPVVDTINSE
jgi:hypothetical protein